jgi:hypothetical protein
VILLARHARGGRLRVPSDRVWLVWIAAVVCFLVVVDADILPSSWYFYLNIAGESAPYIWPRSHVWVEGATVTVTWSYGAAVAVAAALILLFTSVVSPGPPAPLADESPDLHSSPAAGDSIQATT